MHNLEIKKHLMALVILRLKKKLELLSESMKEAQESANYHIGAAESRYDTFKEESQALKDGFAVQYKKTADVLAVMQQSTVKTSTEIELGAIICTDGGAFFISTGLIEEPLKVGGVKYDCVNINAPIVQKLRQSKNKRIF